MAIRRKKLVMEEPGAQKSSAVEDLLRELTKEVRGLRSDLVRAAVLGGTVAKIGPRGLDSGAIKSLASLSNNFADVAKDVG